MVVEAWSLALPVGGTLLIALGLVPSQRRAAVRAVVRPTRLVRARREAVEPQADVAIAVAEVEPSSAPELAPEPSAELVSAVLPDVPEEFALEDVAPEESVPDVVEVAPPRRWWDAVACNLGDASIEARMAIASALGELSQPWTIALIVEALATEDHPSVRARLVGALATDPRDEHRHLYAAAFACGGIEAAAVWEMLLPRRDALPWVDGVLRLEPADPP